MASEIEMTVTINMANYRYAGFFYNPKTPTRGDDFNLVIVDFTNGGTVFKSPRLKLGEVYKFSKKLTANRDTLAFYLVEDDLFFDDEDEIGAVIMEKDKKSLRNSFKMDDIGNISDWTGNDPRYRDFLNVSLKRIP
jgi:hypothetical protein